MRKIAKKRSEVLTLTARLGRQDKSADGCRAHVVGWTEIFSSLAPGETGSFLRKHSNINNSGASRPHRAGVIP